MPAEYAARLDPAMAVRLLNYAPRRRHVDGPDMPFPPIRLRGYRSLLRGLLSDLHVPLDHELAVSSLREALGGREVCVHHFHGDYNGIELRLVFEDWRLPKRRTRRLNDVVAPGLYLRNSEVGLEALECFLLRLVCKNGLVVAADSTLYRWRHVAVHPEHTARELRQAVARVTDEAVEASGLFDRAAERGVRGGARGSPGSSPRRSSGPTTTPTTASSAWSTQSRPWRGGGRTRSGPGWRSWAGSF